MPSDDPQDTTNPAMTEKQIREALAERAEQVTPAQFEEYMKAIAEGR